MYVSHTLSSVLNLLYIYINHIIFIIYYGSDNLVHQTFTYLLYSKMRNFTTSFSFYKQPSWKGSNVKNSLNVKQPAKQLPTLKALMQKILVGL